MGGKPHWRCMPTTERAGSQSGGLLLWGKKRKGSPKVQKTNILLRVNVIVFAAASSTSQHVSSLQNWLMELNYGQWLGFTSNRKLICHLSLPKSRTMSSQTGLDRLLPQCEPSYFPIKTQRLPPNRTVSNGSRKFVFDYPRRPELTKIHLRGSAAEFQYGRPPAIDLIFKWALCF